MTTEPPAASMCKICLNSEGNHTIIAREMMFGFRDRFEYLECAGCGCLQIKEIPRDLAKYYPDNYLPFRQQPGFPSNGSKTKLQKLKKKFSRSDHIFKYLMNKRYLPGMLLLKIFRHMATNAAPGWLIEKKLDLRLNSNSRILDVGCGVGSLLLDFHSRGYTNLLGVDRFIKEDISYGNGFKIIKTEVDNLTEQFDLIMLHHSFEHMPDPLSNLLKLYDLLKPRGYLLIRIPLASSFAWRKYGVDWAQLDAPRHFFLHTTKSMELLTKQAGFSIAELLFDSTAFQFWGSEQYRRDIPFNDERSYVINPSRSIFSQKQIESFMAEAVELNKKCEGDQACFFLTKNNSQH